MRQTYIVTYDICDPKRLRGVFKLMRGLRRSPAALGVRCELSRQELAELKKRLGDKIHNDEDQVLFVDVGPADGRAEDAITALGQPYVGPNASPSWCSQGGHGGAIVDDLISAPSTICIFGGHRGMTRDVEREGAGRSLAGLEFPCGERKRVA
jgi:CRISPR-associated protein Cas2